MRSLGVLMAGLMLPLTAGRAAADEGGAPSPPPAGDAIAPVDKLTPVRPAPPQHRLPAYQLYLEVDAPLLTIATVFVIGRAIRGGLAPAYCAPVPGSSTEQSTHCNPATLNWLDRQVAGRYHPSWDK